MCNPSKKTNPIQDVINGLKIKEGAPSALVGEFYYTQDFNSSVSSPPVLLYSSKRFLNIYIILRWERVIVCSVFLESAEGADLYVAYSGNKDHVGIHKFGENKVRPATNDKGICTRDITPPELCCVNSSS